MGQKVNPIGLRLGINRTWDSRWFARKDYSTLLHEDLKLRKFLADRLGQAGVSRIVIERAAKNADASRRVHAGGSEWISIAASSVSPSFT